MNPAGSRGGLGCRRLRPLLRGEDRRHARLLGRQRATARPRPPGRHLHRGQRRPHTCGVKTDGTLACWGNNDDGQAHPARRHLHRGQRRRLPHLRRQDRRHPRLLGRQQLRPGHARRAGTFTAVSAGGATPAASGRTAPSPAGATTTTARPPRPRGTFTRSAPATPTPAASGPTARSPAGATTARPGHPARAAPSPRSAPAPTTPAASGPTAPSPAGATTAYGQADAARAAPSPQVSAGTYHTCGVKTDGTLACWGDNSYGQRPRPRGTFTAVSAGSLHTCGVKTDGTLACWGSNGYGQATAPERHLHRSQRRRRLTPAGQDRRHAGLLGQQRGQPDNLPERHLHPVSAGTLHACGLQTDGTLACWGRQRLRRRLDNIPRRHLHPAHRRR